MMVVLMDGWFINIDLTESLVRREGSIAKQLTQIAAPLQPNGLLERDIVRAFAAPISELGEMSLDTPARVVECLALKAPFLLCRHHKPLVCYQKLHDLAGRDALAWSAQSRAW